MAIPYAVLVAKQWHRKRGLIMYIMFHRQMAKAANPDWTIVSGDIDLYAQ
ncbi:MAG TPA: hypothetical protein V6D22_03565 [Candidatus Obscuribacterales bacterium]